MKLCLVCKNTYPDKYRSCPRDQAPLTEATPEIVPGTILRGKYEVLSELGAGGMATVYKVRHRAFHEIVAVKIVHTHFMHDSDFIKRFRNEAVVARQLKHPNAVRIDDFDYTDDGRPFIVMEFVDGRSLYQLRKDGPGPWSVDRCLNIVSQAAEALSAAHTLGIVHRDIKPANILLLRGERERVQVKVLDFGIAKVSTAGAFAGMTSVLTQQSMVIGTPEYMSPEQAQGQSETGIDGRSDLYSLGLVLYEMLTGAHPFRADTPMGMLMQQVSTQPPPPDSIVRGLPPAISALVLKALEKDPEKRFQSTAEFLSALKNAESSYTVQSGPAYAEPLGLGPAAVPDVCYNTNTGSSGTSAIRPVLDKTPGAVPSRSNDEPSSRAEMPLLVGHASSNMFGLAIQELHRPSFKRVLAGAVAAGLMSLVKGIVISLISRAITLFPWFLAATTAFDGSILTAVLFWFNRRLPRKIMGYIAVIWLLKGCALGLIRARIVIPGYWVYWPDYTGEGFLGTGAYFVSLTIISGAATGFAIGNALRQKRWMGLAVGGTSSAVAQIGFSYLFGPIFDSLQHAGFYYPIKMTLAIDSFIYGFGSAVGMLWFIRDEVFKQEASA